MPSTVQDAVIRETGRDCIYKKLAEPPRWETSLTIRSAGLCTRGRNGANWIFRQFSEDMNSTFIVHRTIQVLIWGRMTPCGEDRLPR